MGTHFPSPKNSESAVRAAGGLVWRPGVPEPELLVIRRCRHGADEWSLPKGKLDSGETYPEAALREVAEETGVRARLGRFAGVLQYAVNGQNKVVCMWEMTAESVGRPEDTDEVAEIRWVPREEALRLLTHEQNRELLRHLPPPEL
ncbi:MAG: NUDIX hydrolase [Verrucomicrobiae bacterium]|nr:NUDIX hydrolase [Verrucomicrobiae bacterium]